MEYRSDSGLKVRDVSTLRPRHLNFGASVMDTGARSVYTRPLECLKKSWVKVVRPQRRPIDVGAVTVTLPSLVTFKLYDSSMSVLGFARSSGSAPVCSRVMVVMYVALALPSGSKLESLGRSIHGTKFLPNKVSYVLWTAF